MRCRRLGLAGKLVHELPLFHGNASDHLLKETETGLEPLQPWSRALDLIEALAETWHRSCGSEPEHAFFAVFVHELSDNEVNGQIVLSFICKA